MGFHGSLQKPYNTWAIVVPLPGALMYLASPEAPPSLDILDGSGTLTGSWAAVYCEHAGREYSFYGSFTDD
jgi:hypothetical protein